MNSPVLPDDKWIWASCKRKMQNIMMTERSSSDLKCNANIIALVDLYAHLHSVPLAARCVINFDQSPLAVWLRVFIYQLQIKERRIMAWSKRGGLWHNDIPDFILSGLSANICSVRLAGRSVNCRKMHCKCKAVQGVAKKKRFHLYPIFSES